MKLVHYSGRPRRRWRTARPESQAKSIRMGPFQKPRGLWVTIDDEPTNWPTWCEDNQFGLDRLTYRTLVQPMETANLLIISDADQLRDFHNQYSEVFSYGDKILEDYKFRCIDWRRVAKDYHGIIITPHINEMHLDNEVHWYYTWDCASGCIWDLRHFYLSYDGQYISPRKEEEAK